MAEFHTEPGECREGVDDEKTSRDRVALAHETVETYDPSYYERHLVRAVESVLAPLGWDRADIRDALADTRATTLAGFTASAGPDP